MLDMESLVLTLTKEKGEVMGYTHYFEQTRDFTDKEWQEIKSFAAQLLRRGSFKLIIDCKYDQKFKINDKHILFNGIKNEGHETFVLDKLKGRHPDYYTPQEIREAKGVFNFCKTAQKPYDDYVVAFLCGVNVLAPGALIITSDGWKHEWKDGLNLAQYICGNGDFESYRKAVATINIPQGIEEEVSHG